MEKSEIRKPAVAGQFYPSITSELNKQIEAFIDQKVNKIEAIACMMPHAGYIYSGEVAVKTACRINIKDKIILLGPNHTGYGIPFSVMTEGIWQTPLGQVKIDSDLAGKIVSHCKYLGSDRLAHIYEHSLEVELPILQYLKAGFEFVPVIFASDDFNALREIGKDIASVISETNIRKSVTIIASSDMTHYESQAQAEKKDKQAIEAILELDEDKLIERVRSLDISMCGYAPVVVMLCAAKCLGAKKAELVKYSTSADVTGDRDSVVGYAGVTIY